MARQRSEHPTNAELAILRVLWKRGSGTVADVRDGLDGGRDIGYTTVLKLLQIMAAKGLLRRNENVRPHVYRPAVNQEVTQRGMVKDLIERAFGGSSADLVQRALDAKPASRKELSEIRKLLDGMKGDSE